MEEFNTVKEPEVRMCLRKITRSKIGWLNELEEIDERGSNKHLSNVDKNTIFCIRTNVIQTFLGFSC